MSKTPRQQLAAYADFFERHGHVIENALAVYAERMRETAAGCEQASHAPEILPGDPVQHEDGTRSITLTPTPGGYAGMARLFTESAERAEQASRAYADLAEDEEY